MLLIDKFFNGPDLSFFEAFGLTEGLRLDAATVVFFFLFQSGAIRKLRLVRLAYVLLFPSIWVVSPALGLLLFRPCLLTMVAFLSFISRLLPLWCIDESLFMLLLDLEFMKQSIKKNFVIDSLFACRFVVEGRIELSSSRKIRFFVVFNGIFCPSSNRSCLPSPG